MMLQAFYQMLNGSSVLLIRNMALAGPETLDMETASVFDLSTAPNINLSQYTLRMTQFAAVTPMHMVPALIYIDRLVTSDREKCPELPPI